MEGFESFLDNIIYDNHLYQPERYTDCLQNQKGFDDGNDQLEFGTYGNLRYTV